MCRVWDSNQHRELTCQAGFLICESRSEKLITKWVFLLCLRNECLRNEFLPMLNAYRTSAHESSFFTCLRNEFSRSEVFCSAHGTSAHETSFYHCSRNECSRNELLTLEQIKHSIEDYNFYPNFFLNLSMLFLPFFFAWGEVVSIRYMQSYS